VFKEKLGYFRDVRDGVIDDPTSLGVLYEWPEKLLEEEAYLNPALFYVTNPNLGRSVSAEWLAAELAKEMRGDGEGKQVFLAKHLNVEIGIRMRRDRWRGADSWEGAAEPGLTLDELLARCEVAVVGIDGGGLDDLFGLCVAGRERATERWLYWFKAWAWRDVLDLRKEIAPALKDFAADGDLVLCGGEAAEAADEGGEGYEQDVREIVEIVRHVQASGLLPEKGAVGLDPQGVGVLVDGLTGLGLTQAQLVAVSQGFRLSSAVWSMERKLKFGRAVHNGSAMMAWCVGNAKAEQKGNAVIITKEAAGKAKIDPLIAGFNATKLLEANPEAGGRSVYEERGLVMV
jgi:phage terminase large subunit-like protein